MILHARFVSPEPRMAPKLGIVVGGGDLPALLVAACKAAGRDYCVLAIDGHTDIRALAESPIGVIRLGEVGKGIKILHEAGVKELVFAGAVRRPSMIELRPDLRTTKFFAKLGCAWIGDNSLLSAIVKEMEAEGFTVIAPETLLQDSLAFEGCYGSIKPNHDTDQDIEIGIRAARDIGALDIGQAVVVQQGIVLGTENSEGTDALMERCRDLQRVGPGGVLVKMRKPGQDRRIDLPAIGANTVQTAAKTGLRGIVVEAGGTLVVNREDVCKVADNLGIFVVGVPVKE